MLPSNARYSRFPSRVPTLDPMAQRVWRTVAALAAALTITGITAAGAFAADPNPFETGEPVGDGFSVIPTATRIFNVNHHDPTRLDCRELENGARCAGYPFAHPSLAETGLAPHGAIDAATGHLWVAGQAPGSAKDIGFACIDIGVDARATPTSCGWVTTGTGPLANDGDRGGSIHSGDEYNRKLYSIDTNGTIYCLNMATAAACANQPFDVGLPDSDKLGTHLTRIGNTSKFIARTSPTSPNFPIAGPGPSKVICFDAATDAVCAGWTVPFDMGSSGATVNGSVIPVGTGWDAFCGIVSANTTGSNVGSGGLNITCRTLANGTSIAAPTALSGIALTGGTTGWQFGVAGLGEADTFGTRVYFAMTRYVNALSLDINDRLVCYDTATGALCPGYPSDFFGGAPGQSSSKTYAATVDATGTCVWTLGDEGIPVHRKADTPNDRCYAWTGPPTTTPPPTDPPPTTTTPPTTTPPNTLPTRTTNDVRITIPQSIGCQENKLLLTDVFPLGGRTRLLGVAPSAAVGKKVTLRSSWNRKIVATPTVKPDLTFAVSVPLPPKRIRFGNKARYIATWEKQRTLNLKFARRMYTTSITRKGSTIIFKGVVTKPLAKPIRRVILRASASCSTIRKGKIVAKVMPAKNGAFTARFKRPAGMTVVYMRAQTRVRRYANRTSTSDTFTLIRGIRVPR